MKRMIFINFSLIAAVLMIAGCATTPKQTSELLVSNSNNFDYKSTDMNVIKLKARPDWVENVEKWSNRSDDKLYFIGSSEPSFSQISGDWTMSNAKSEAAKNAHMQVRHYISSMVHGYFNRDENIFFTISVPYSGTISGLMLEPEGVFYELYEIRRDGPSYSVYHFWQIYSIPEEEIDKAREKVLANR